MKLIITLFACMSLSAIAQDWKPVSDVRENLEQVLVKTPYKDPEHATIKAYFTQLENFKAQLESNQKIRKRFSAAIRTQGPEVVCGEIFLSQSLWDQLIKNCTRNGFFLCTDDAREFPVYKKDVMAQVETSLQEQTRSAISCQ